MAAGVNFLKLFDADLGVNGRGVKFFMPKQLLDEPDVRPVFQHVRRAGVPQQVARGHAPRHLPEATKTIGQFWKRKNARRNGINDESRKSDSVVSKIRQLS
jgi:hypothetical protein